MIQFRDYQERIIEKGSSILRKLGIAYLSMEVRTGKTLTALGIADTMKVSKVLFITKKKAISSIQDDYKALNPSYDITIINYESLHKIDTKADLYIVDEAHSLGAFPKPSKRTKKIKEIIGRKYLILLSGTPTPESWSQIYHQFWISDFSPFTETSFYKWSHAYVDIKKTFVAHGNTVNDYSNARIELIKPKIRPFILSYTQKQAGFTSEVKEEILEVEMKPSTYQLIDILERDLVFKGKNGGVILGDTSVKLMQKVHQLYSGTVKLEDGSAKIIDKSKGFFIRDRFAGKKIAIFYQFKEELKLLQEVFGDNLTQDLDIFNSTSKNIALQFVSGREGISLKNAEYLVNYNIDFSATTYWQSRDRLTTKERTFNKVYWIFSKGGLEHKIYQTVLGKRNFTTKYYDRSKIPEQSYQTA